MGRLIILESLRFFTTIKSRTRDKIHVLLHTLDKEMVVSFHHLRITFLASNLNDDHDAALNKIK